MIPVNIKTEPKPRITPPKTSINVPKTPKITLILMSFRVSSFSSVLINLETSIEFMKIATNNDEPSTTESVIGK